VVSPWSRDTAGGHKTKKECRRRGFYAALGWRLDADFVDGAFRAGTDGRVPGPDPERRSYASFASFRDPDGNSWLLQQITTRLPGR
jgi:hypothetical protein